MKFLSLILIFILHTNFLKAQTAFKKLDHLFTDPANYIVSYTAKSPVIDGDLNDAEWSKATWTDTFVDIEGDLKPKPTLNTRVKMLWTDTCLLIAAELKEPHVWAKLTKHDQVVFYDNDFEVFIDPDNDTHRYFEIEVNALNTIFDLFLSKPYRNNSGALISWDAQGMRSAVKVQGTINQPNDIDEGWTVEISIPFRAITIGNEPRIPQEGSLWRINFSRVEWDTEIKNGLYSKKKNAAGHDLPEHNWVWSPQGVINMHYPERWGYLQFTKKEVAGFKLPYEEQQRKILWQLYYRQHEYRAKHKRYAQTLAELEMSASAKVDGSINVLKLEATAKQFTASINAQNHQTITINDEGLVEVSR